MAEGVAHGPWWPGADAHTKNQAQIHPGRAHPARPARQIRGGPSVKSRAKPAKIVVSTASAASGAGRSVPSVGATCWGVITTHGRPTSGSGTAERTGKDTTRC
jgi:hypothetical protein